MPTLTKRQKQIYDYLKDQIEKHGFSPTFEEIAKRFKLSALSGIHQHIKALIEKEMIVQNKHSARGIELANKGEMIKIPLLGIIAAGQPIEAVQNKETIAVPKMNLPKSDKLYALQVAGDSMLDENIQDGDIILVKQQNTANNGDKVVALIDNNEATLKKFYQEKNQIRLQPANKNLLPIIIKKNQSLSIQGIFVDLIKNYYQKPIILDKNNEPSDEKSKNNVLKKYLNNVFNGDILELLKNLPDKSVDMVFGDPDYNVGIKYGDNTYTKSFDEYIEWYIKLTKESMRVLKEDGNLFMINYPKQNAHLRVKYLDEIYPLISDYAWVFNSNVGHSPQRFTTAHRSILHIRKSVKNKFYKDAIALPYKNPNDRRILNNLKNGSNGRMPYSWFYFNLVKNVSKEKTYHACQIPQKLTEMLVKSCTIEGDIILVLFGGSGAELEICKKLERKFISAEIDKKYHALIMDRLANGYIKEKYKLKTKNKKREFTGLNLSFSAT